MKSNSLISANIKQINTKLFLAHFSILLVFFSGLPVAAEKGATLLLLPNSQSFEIEEKFSVEVFLDSGFSVINTAQAVIYFPSDKLEVVSLSKDNSIFSLWPEEPAFFNSDGQIHFGGGLPSPGFQGQGKIITIEFKAKAKGDAEINFGEAQVLANDGRGTNVLAYLKKTKYFIFETMPSSQIFSLTHPKQDQWYNNNSPLFEWILDQDVKKVSFVLDENSETVPDDISEGLIQSTKYYGLSDGFWYFHLRLANYEGWSETNHYKIQIDTSPPSSFEIAVDNSGDPTNPQPSLYFESLDNTSGVKVYRMKVDQDDFFDLMTAQMGSVSLSLLKPGSHHVIVRAVDEAGNIAQAESLINIEPLETPHIIVCPEEYVAGEETFYLQGTSLPNVKIIILLKDDKQEVREWRVLSNERGEWSFSTKELLKTDIYSLSIMAEDERGAVSDFSGEKQIEVLFNGIVLGQLMVSFKSLSLFFFIILIIGTALMLYFYCKSQRNEKMLIKEIWEAEQSLKENFDSLEEEIIKRIEMIDNQPGFNQEERAAYEHIKESLLSSKEKIEKEIKDIKVRLQ